MAENLYTTTQEINNSSVQVSSAPGYSPYKVLYPHDTFSLNNISQNNNDNKLDRGKVLSQITEITEQAIYEINQIGAASLDDNTSQDNDNREVMSRITEQAIYQLNQINATYSIIERAPSPINIVPIVPPSTPTYSRDEGFDFINSQSLDFGGISTKELQLNMNKINYTNMLPFMNASRTINMTWPNIQNHQYVNIASTMDMDENSFTSNSNSTIMNDNGFDFDFDEFIDFDDGDDMADIDIAQNQTNNNNPGNSLVNEFQNLKLGEK